MKYFFVISSLFISFFLSLFTGFFFAPKGIPPPFVFAVLAFWFWRLDFLPALWISVILGFIMDSVSILPFGTHILLFLIASTYARIIKTLLSNNESLLIRGSGMGTIFFLLIFLNYPCAFIMDLFKKSSPVFDGVFMIHLFVASAIWTLILFLSLLFMQSRKTEIRTIR